MISENGEKLIKQIEDEFENFKSAMLERNKEDIFESAFEIDTKDNIRMVARNVVKAMEERGAGKYINYLASSKNALNEVYEEYRNSESNDYDLAFYNAGKAISESVNRKGAMALAYESFECDYMSEDFQSNEVGGGYPIMICVNVSEHYAYLLPCSDKMDGFEKNFEDAYEDCVNFGRRSCYDIEDYNNLAREVADKTDYRNRLEQGEGDTLDEMFSETLDLTQGNSGRK